MMYERLQAIEQLRTGAYVVLVILIGIWIIAKLWIWRFEKPLRVIRRKNRT